MREDSRENRFVVARVKIEFSKGIFIQQCFFRLQSFDKFERKLKVGETSERDSESCIMLIYSET